MQRWETLDTKANVSRKKKMARSQYLPNRTIVMKAACFYYKSKHRASGIEQKMQKWIHIPKVTSFLIKASKTYNAKADRSELWT